MGNALEEFFSVLEVWSRG